MTAPDFHRSNSDAASTRALDTRPSRRWLLQLFCAAVGCWLATGFFVVGGDESGVVRVFGRAERSEDGTVRLRSNGVYWHLPWPCSTIDRVRLGEVRTVSVGSSEAATSDQTDLLRLLEPAARSQFLTGDRNILQVQLNVQYRVSADAVEDWLYSAGDIEERLQMLSQAALSDVVLQSGVDFVHTLGHSEICAAVFDRLVALSDTSHLGITIEDVTIAGVAPPARVKSHFVDVMNARADRETYINRARAYAEQQHADAGASSRQILDQAESYRQKTTDLAQAEADSFNRLIDQLEATAKNLSLSYAEARQLAVQRQRLDTLQQLYPRVKTQVLLDETQPVDLTLHRTPLAE
jgi:membrane protease subunit HflK